MVDIPGGGKKTDMHALNMRVVDSYTRMPVGMVVHGENKFQAFYFLADKKKSEVNEIEGEWGPRFDQAVNAIWKAYSKSLPPLERVRRLGWRWSGAGWFLVGLVWGVLTSFIVQAMTSNWSFS